MTTGIVFFILFIAFYSHTDAAIRVPKSNQVTHLLALGINDLQFITRAKLNRLCRAGRNSHFYHIRVHNFFLKS